MRVCSNIFKKIVKTNNVISVCTGNQNVWCKIGMITLSLDKIKTSEGKNELDKQAELQLTVSSSSKSDRYFTKKKQLRKHTQGYKMS